MSHRNHHGTAALASILLAVFLALPASGQPRCELDRVTPPNPADNGFFSVGADVSGNFAVTGAPGAGGSGLAYAYTFDGAAWVYQMMLVPFDGQGGDEFGAAAAIDGDTIVIGAPENYGTGSVYIFRHSGVEWARHAKINPHDGAGGDLFGSSVDISGNTIVIGAPGANESAADSGAAYVFTFTGQGWDQQAKLTYSGGLQNDYFGTDVAISGDVVVVGSEAETDAGANAGEVYVFRLYEGEWEEEAALQPADAQAGAEFGEHVAIDGDVILAGARYFGTSAIGAAYIFRYEQYDWVQEARLRSSDLPLFQHFGADVSVSGNVALIGASNDPDLADQAGAAYVFEFDGSNWIEQEKIYGSQSGYRDGFGSAVALDQDNAIIGEPYSDNPDSRSGAAYFFNFADCNNNGLCDALDLIQGDSQDCNANFKPDECDVLEGTSADCDGNEIPDECDVQFVSETSSPIGPLGYDYEWLYQLERLPLSGGDVEITITAVGDLGALTEWLDVELNGVNIGRVFATDGNDCPRPARHGADRARARRVQRPA